MTEFIANCQINLPGIIFFVFFFLFFPENTQDT